MEFLFLRLDETAAQQTAALAIDERLSWSLWKPSYRTIVPNGISLRPFGVWWLFHCLHVYRCRDYGILVIYDGKRLVHRSCVFPKWLRFPFMNDIDLQIADTWTHPDYRGKGLAAFAASQIVSLCRRDGRVFWYFARIGNMASIRVAKKIGFRECGKGSRVSGFGCRSLGRYQIEERV
ncbi:MAG: GNAT family N-acetyltransferase [Planctomycetaceae bacterium]|nr:GNAT family N-acetyltransferase [Planctomycetaceae bacterium]